MEVKDLPARVREMRVARERTVIEYMTKNNKDVEWEEEGNWKFNFGWNLESKKNFIC